MYIIKKRGELNETKKNFIPITISNCYFRMYNKTIKSGKIIIGIDNKVYFEPDGLEKPNWDILSACFVKYGCDTEDIKRLYDQKMKRHEASKQLIEVSNVTKKLKEWYYDVIGIHCKNTDRKSVV